MTLMRIDSFKGEHEFLSNFADSVVTYGGMKFKTVEHAYQAAKTLDEELRLRIQAAASPGIAKKLGRPPAKGGIVVLRRDWEEIKLKVMLKLVRQKFRDHPELAAKLLATGDAELIEGNWWGDTFWGVCKGVGENNLGKILMQVRDELREALTLEHDWINKFGTIMCLRCGVLKRRDGKNKECKGLVRVALREG